MKKNTAVTIAFLILSALIGFSSAAVAKTGASATSSEDQMTVTLPEIVCTAKRAPVQEKISYREYLNEAVESIRESMEQITLKNIMEEVKSVLHHPAM